MQRWGRKFTWPAVVISPFLPIPNAIIFVIAGWAGMRLLTFIILDLIGSLLWAGMLVGLGYELGHHAVVVAQTVSHYGLWISLALVAVIVVAQVRSQRHMIARRLPRPARARARPARRDRSPEAIRLPADPEDLASVHLAPLVGVVPSLAWAVVRGQDVAAGGFGGVGPRTIFQIGSVTKVFTALLLADMAERGEVRLSDPAARYLPGWRGGTGSVTLADLATHTSGLPRLPRSLLWSALLHPRDPYARYPAARFVRAARRALRAGSAGSPYLYSNFGYGLLGYLLGQAAGTAYQALVTTRICGPLGLPDTTFTVPGPSQDRMSRDRMAQGYRRGRAVPDWHLGALAGAGALYSTAADLARFLQACLTPAATPLEPAIRATLTPRRPIPGGEIGLAWHHARGGDHRVIWHNGMTGGFSAMIAFDPARALGVAALANSAAGPPSWTKPSLARSASQQSARRA